MGDQRFMTNRGRTATEPSHGESLNVRKPILVVVNTAAANRSSTYIVEMLDIEGFVSKEVADVAGLPLRELPVADYAVVIAAEGAIQEGDEDFIRRTVAEDGVNLVAMRPPSGLADVFGLEQGHGLNQTVADKYVVFDEHHALGQHLLASYTQFHGVADLYRGAGCDVLGRIAVEPNGPTGFVAIATHTYGHGRTAAFTYCLATSTVVFHQGQISNSSIGANPDADDDGRWVPNDLFVDVLDPRLKFVPQADVQQDMLVRILNDMTRDRMPLPRLWYFPNAAPCVAYINGDSDGMAKEDYDTVLSLVERHGGVFSAYLMTKHHELFTRQEADALRARGHNFGQHVILEWDATVADGEAQVAEDMQAFEQHFGYRPSSNRGHCLIWPGWTEMAATLRQHGVRLDQNYIPRRFYRHGYLNGSGLPVKFMTSEGQLLDIYEQNTHLTDDGEVEEEKFLVPGHDQQVVITYALKMLQDCESRFHGVFQAAFHPHLTSRKALWLLEAVLRYCRDHDIPMVNGEFWVKFNDARRAIDLDVDVAALAEGRLRLTLTSPVSVEGITVMLPEEAGSGRLRELSACGDPAGFQRVFWKGQRYGVLPISVTAGAGTEILAEYEPIEG